MDLLAQIFIAISCAFITSSGFWAYFQKRLEKNDVKTEMLIGLGHDRIVNLCLYYLDRGDWITADEYENLQYLYKPYKKMGGNGSAERLMDEVDKRLRIIPAKYQDDNAK